jgi:membrane fusion protein (multidrug efflux system)
MSENPETSNRPENPPPSKEEIKREVKKEIAEAISKALGGDGAAPGGGQQQGSGQKEPGKNGGNGEKKKGFKWTPVKVILLVAVVLVLLVVGIYYIVYSIGHETTDDAYTSGFVHQISSRVTSNVTQLLIVDNQFVRQGQVLLQLDPTDFQVALAKAQANCDNAQADFDRVEALKGDVAISKQDYDQTRTNLEVARANLDDARNQLGYCTIVAPTDGYIGNRTVEVGNRVTVGGALMTVVQDVWVTANYKETQLGKMKKNQHVEINVDAIPGKTFQGHVDSFSPGTGSTFALLPPDNATGNFTKIVQRVPVKIYFEPDSIKDFRGRLFPGLSVETSVTLDTSVRQTDDQATKAGQ